MPHANSSVHRVVSAVVVVVVVVVAVAAVRVVGLLCELHH